MLTRIHIRNLIIVSNLELELGAGMSVLSGETGAGKSILIDALGLVLGDRADPEMVRSGCDRAEIIAEFDLSQQPTLRTWLAQQELDSDGECLLRRVVVRKGSSRAFINGSAVPARLLQSLGQQLVDIHGQHAHQSLLRRDHQRQLLDDYAGHRELVSGVAALFHDWQQRRQALEALRRASRERVERLDLLRFQIDELEQLNLQPNELEELASEQLRLSSADQLREGCGQLVEQLYNSDQSLHASTASAASELAHLAESDPHLRETGKLLEEAAIQLEEAGRSLRDYLSDLESDPQRLAQLDQRLGEIHHLARKYRRRPEQLSPLLEELHEEREQLEHADIHLAALERECATLGHAYLGQATTLDQRRRKAARRLEREVTRQMQQLGMPDGRLEIAITTLDPERASASGINRIEILVAANPGQPLQSLAKSASGGELSRISLAIQVATAQCNGTPTLIFDEVDVGIGGGIAEIVGQLLRRLGANRQVLCVTHLPQVAAQGHHHLCVQKQNRDGQTFTQITPLTHEQRSEEIARMLGGVEITEKTLKHAEEMVQRVGEG